MIRRARSCLWGCWALNERLHLSVFMPAGAYPLWLPQSILSSILILPRPTYGLENY